MQLQFILITALCSHVLLQCSSSSSIYKCVETNFKDNQCMLLSTKIEKDGQSITTRSIYSLSNCSSSQVCLTLESNTNIGVCVEKSDLFVGFDSDSCKNNADCYSYNCSNKKCVGIANGEACPGPYSCLKTSSCIKGNSTSILKCHPIVAPNADCISDYVCPFGYLCGKSSKAMKMKQCIKMFSIEFGEYSSVDYLCKTGKTYTFDRGTNYVCSKTSKIAVEPCKTKDDCQIVVTDGKNSSSYKSDSCSWNGVDAYSQITFDDLVFQDYLNYYQELILNRKESDFKNLEYARKNYWDDEKLANLYSRTFYFAEMKGADECAINYFINSKINTVTLLELSILAMLLF